MDFVSLNYDQKKAYVTNLENHKKIKAFISRVKYQAITHPFTGVTEEVYEMTVFVNSLGRMISDFVVMMSGPSFQYPDLVFDWGKNIIPEDIRNKNIKMKRLIDLFIFCLSSFLETSLAACSEVRRTIENIEDEFSGENSWILTIMGLRDPIGIMKDHLYVRLNQWQDSIADIWEMNSDPVTYSMNFLNNTFDKYPEMIGHFPDDWSQLIQCIDHCYPTIVPPRWYTSVACRLMNVDGVSLPLRIICRKWFLQENIRIPDETRNMAHACQDAIKIIEKNISESQNFLECIYAIRSVSQLLDHCSISNICRRDLENLVYSLCSFMKHNYEFKKDEYQNSVCFEYQIPEIVHQVFRSSEKWSDERKLHETYLLRHVLVCFMDCLQKEENELDDNDVETLFKYLEKFPLFLTYLATLYDKESIVKNRGLFTEEFYQSALEKVEKFSSVDAAEFTDTITSSLIVVPGIIKNGEHVIWVDAYMMKSHLKEKGENPFTREKLTVEAWEAYNLEAAEMIAEYDRRRREVVN